MGIFGRRRSKSRISSVEMNELAYQYYYDLLFEIACSVFRWNGLPVSIDTVELEKVLLTNGKALIYFDEVMESWYALPYVPQDGFDVYGYPKRRRVYSRWNAYKITCDSSNSVVIFDNKSRSNRMLDVVQYYALRLYNLDRAVDVNANAQKTPVLITGTKNQMLTVRNAYQQFDGNMPVIAGSKKFDPDCIKSLTTGAPFVGEEMNALKVAIWNDFLTSVGVPNVNVQKKERLIKDEVIRGSGGTLACRYPRLDTRQRGCDYINCLPLWKDTIGSVVSVNYKESGD